MLDLHINMVDMHDAHRRTGIEARTFPTEEGLAEYTMEKKRFFPLRLA